MRTGRRFSFRSFVEFLNEYKQRAYTSEDGKRIMQEFILDDSFVDAMFDPTQDNTSPATNDLILQMYGLLGRKRIMKLIIDALKDFGEAEGYKTISRSVAAFVFTVAFKNSDANRTRMDDLEANYNKGRINDRQYEDAKEELEEYSACISNLIHITKKIVKKPAKRLAAETNLPRDLLESVLCYMPEKKYVSKPQIAQYLDYIQNGLYPYIHRKQFDVDSNKVKWEPLFLYLFGESNILDACIAILLTNKKDTIGDLTDDYDKIDSLVLEAWDSLTLFALGELEKAPESIKSHLLEIYGKKLNVFLKSGVPASDIRLNVMDTLNDYDFKDQYPTLYDTIFRFKDRFQNILNENSNRPTSSSGEAIMPNLNK